MAPSVLNDIGLDTRNADADRLAAGNKLVEALMEIQKVRGQVESTYQAKLDGEDMRYQIP
jgi:hypothetical protein